MSPVLLLVLAGGFSLVDTVDGVRVEAREVKGSDFKELRLTATSPKPVKALCDAAYGDGSVSKEEAPTVKRTVLREGANERVLYEQRMTPIVSARDYVVHWKRAAKSDGSCVVSFDTTTELAPPVKDGWVRVDKIRGTWTFTRDGEQTRIEYVSYSEPGGSIPAFISEGPRRDLEVKVLKTVLRVATR